MITAARSDDTTARTAAPAARHLSVITRQPDSQADSQPDIELALVQGIVTHAHPVDGRGDLELLLGELLAAGRPPGPRTLDLIGHSTPGSALLQLGGFVIDTTNPVVASFFRELAEQDVLPRLGIHALRLLGSKTAETEQGRQTICTLARILGVEVYGALGPLYAASYDAHGLRADARYLLRCATDMRGDLSCPPEPRAQRSPRALDLDALPSVALTGAVPWPRHIATIEVSREFLRLVRRQDGVLMPGLLALPSCELALPTHAASSFHVAQILLDHELVRVYPDGPGQPSVVYPVSDPNALHALIESLQPPVPVVAANDLRDPCEH